MTIQTNTNEIAFLQGLAEAMDAGQEISPRAKAQILQLRSAGIIPAAKAVA